MLFTSIIKVEAVNPNTSEVVTGYRAVASNGKEYKIANTLDEMKAAGTPTEMLSKLIVQTGQFGDYVQIRKYKVLETVSAW